MALLDMLLGKLMEGAGFKVVDHFHGEEILIFVMTEKLEHQEGFNFGSKINF